jgi:sugar lactone lactonase YvrE
VDINPGHVHAFDPATGGHNRFAPAGQDGPAVPRDDAVPVGAVGLTRSGGFVLALVDGFALGPAEPVAGGAYPLTRVEGFRVDASLIRFNDGKPSPWGDFWAGTMPWQEGGPACALYRLTPDGDLDTVIRLPVDQPTSMAFGGHDLATLYITTAREALTPAQVGSQPHAGDIFACTPGATGRPPNLFAD